jgi:hypothetical protein
VVNKIQSAKQKLEDVINDDNSEFLDICIAFTMLQQRCNKLIKHKKVQDAIESKLTNWSTFYYSDLLESRFCDMLKNTRSTDKELFKVLLSPIIGILKNVYPIMKLIEDEGMLPALSMIALENMIDQQSYIEQELKKQGICFGQEGELLDYFSLQNLSSWKFWKRSIKGTMPAYKNVLCNMRAYRDGQHGLTDDEEQVLKDNQVAVEKVLKFAEIVMDRSDDIQYHTKLD